jgi:hypothetical protein
MKCLRDKTLLLLHEGEGTGNQRDHLAQCERCAGRYQDLVHDLAAISHILRDKPPQTIAHRFRPPGVRWLPAAVAAVLVLALMWQGVRMWNSSGRRPTAAESGEIWSLLDEFPSGLFSLNEVLAVELLTQVGDYELAAAVLDAERPCEWYDLPARSEIETSTDELEISTGAPFPSCVDMEVNSAHKNR